MIAPELQAMLAKARENHKAAILLLNNDFPEIAASRAYYAMFYTAETLLLSRNLTFSSHSAVIAAFGREFAKTGLLDPRFHRELIDAQDLRHSGDYGSGPQASAGQVQEMLQWAAEFITAAESFLRRE